MACNTCETTFQSYQTLIVSILKSGSNALLYVQNQGRNIAYIRRILICYALPGGSSGVLYLRPPGQPISWTYPSDTLETGITALFYQLNSLPKGTIVQAQAEYVEVEDRSRSCATTI
jgi:hypothetical protein